MTYEIVEAARARTRRAIAAIVVLVLVIVVAITAVMLRSADDSDALPAAPPVVSPVTGPPPAEATGRPEDSVFGPSDITWNDSLGYTWLPVSVSAGPRDFRDRRAVGFSRTPLGAVMAAIHISMRSDAFAGPAIFEPTIAQQVVGFDASQLLKLDQKSYSLSQPDSGLPVGEPLLGDSGVAVLGYRIDAYTDVRADVSVLSRGPDSDIELSQPLSVQWFGDDWRLVAPLNGIWSIEPAGVTGVDYVRFPDRIKQ